MTVRYFFSTLLMATGLLGLALTVSAEVPKTGNVQLLFVQSATSGAYDGTTLTLNGISSTIYFADRPKRIVGHMETRSFVDQWSKGKDSFNTDPPNAVLSVLGDDGAGDSVVELSNPQINGDQISYQVKLLNGEPPKQFNTASLFIDGKAGAFVGGMVVGHMLNNMRR